MVHSLADVLKQLGVSAFNRRGRLPLYGPQSIVCFPPRTEKVAFCKGPYPISCGGLFTPQPAVSISWKDFVVDMVYMFVCWWWGEATGEESCLLSHIPRGRTHTAYHKGASGRKNVYMMSNDSPKIGLPSLILERMIKGSRDKRSQEEENLVCFAWSQSFLNGVIWQCSTTLGRSCYLVTHE